MFSSRTFNKKVIHADIWAIIITSTHISEEYRLMPILVPATFAIRFPWVKTAPYQLDKRNAICFNSGKQ